MKRLLALAVTRTPAGCVLEPERRRLADEDDVPDDHLDDVRTEVHGGVRHHPATDRSRRRRHAAVRARARPEGLGRHDVASARPQLPRPRRERREPDVDRQLRRARRPQAVHRRLSGRDRRSARSAPAWKFKRPDDELAFVDALLAQLESAPVRRSCTRVRDRPLLRRRDDRPRCRANAAERVRGDRARVRVPIPAAVRLEGADADHLLPRRRRPTACRTPEAASSQQVAFETWGATTAARNGCAPKPTESQYRADGRSAHVARMQGAGGALSRAPQRPHVAGPSTRPRPRRADRLVLGQDDRPAVPAHDRARVSRRSSSPTRISLANQDIDASAMIWDFFSHHTRALNAAPQS